MKHLFQLDPEIHYLNHGAFGACPKEVMDDYQSWQRKLEADPMTFMTNTGKQWLNEAKESLATFVNAPAKDLIFVPNPTTAMNTIINSLPLEAGDEVLSTNQEYGAIEKTWKYHCQKKGAHFIQADIPLPIQSKEEFIEAFWKSYNKKTKYIFISHITSTTATIFPVQEICAKAKELGLITIVDGAHVPGHIELDIQSLKADVYTGALHKWLLAPKGNSFLYASEELQNMIDPLIISWGYESDLTSESKFQEYHQFNGTKDFSAYLSTTACIQFFKKYDWENECAKSRKILLDYAPKIVSKLSGPATCPLSNEFLGQMLSVKIKDVKNPLALHQEILQKYKVSVPIMSSPLGNFLRISFQPYNLEEDLIVILSALSDLGL